MPTNRRDFLKGGIAGCFVLSAGPLAQAQVRIPVLADISEISRNAFMQGVGSADPQPDRVMLWTRLAPDHTDGLTGILTLQVSPTASFDQVIVERRLALNKAQDYTLRTLVTGLEPKTDYFYRFITREGISSRTGRTWTAPALNDDVPVSIMSCSCQDHTPSKYGSYRRLIEDENSGKIKRPDMILHLGDYVYGLDPEVITQPLGEDEFGNKIEGDFELALEGYRRIYRKFLTDPDLQDARALYPFVCIWDDHEYSNDPWESYIAGEGSLPQKRVAATQAWFEFVPQVLSESLEIPGAANEAHDFRPTIVENVPMTDFGAGFMSFEPSA